MNVKDKAAIKSKEKANKKIVKLQEKRKKLRNINSNTKTQLIDPKAKQGKTNKTAEIKKSDKDTKPTKKDIGKKEFKNNKTFEIIKGSTKKEDPILIIKNVSKNFGSFQALEDISFSLKRGERIGLIGANGAGKTTISEIIAGINKATSGNITYGMKYKDSPKEAIGMQFQQSTYPSGLSVKDIISFARNLRKLNITNKDLKSLLKVFQMESFYNKKVRSLSGGQRQKLNILLSIIHRPELVILDELSTGLDISAREEIIDFTDNLLKKNKMSAILISHHMQEIERLCSKIIILDKGKVVEISEIKDIIAKHGSLSNFSRDIISKSNKKTEAEFRDLQIKESQIKHKKNFFNLKNNLKFKKAEVENKVLDKEIDIKIEKKEKDKKTKEPVKTKETHKKLNKVSKVKKVEVSKKTANKEEG